MNSSRRTSKGDRRRSRKVSPIGTLGIRHFDQVDKNCYDYGCTDDCPIGGKERVYE